MLGGEGTIVCDGTLELQLDPGGVGPVQIRRLVLKRRETRKAGPVEEGLNVESTLTVDRRAVDPKEREKVPAALLDVSSSPLPSDRERDDRREWLLLIDPAGRYTLEHDRSWHIYWDDQHLTVLKRLDRGEVVAQCNLNVGPKVARGRHQDPDQFRDDVRRALGDRFVQFVGMGEVEPSGISGDDPAAGFRYKVGVQGRQGDVSILWDYYLLASPEGEQVLATFTHAAADRGFGDQDRALIGSFRWLALSALPDPRGRLLPNGSSNFD